MNAAEFKVETGREPENDDLERVNCDKMGRWGHYNCGWCLWCNRPRFECVCKAHDSRPHLKTPENRGYLMPAVSKASGGEAMLNRVWEVLRDHGDVGYWIEGYIHRHSPGDELTRALMRDIISAYLSGENERLKKELEEAEWREAEASVSSAESY